MLKLLHTLTRGRPFEEMYHYASLLREWGHEPPRPQLPRTTPTWLGTALLRYAPGGVHRVLSRLRRRRRSHVRG